MNKVKCKTFIPTNTLIFFECRIFATFNFIKHTHLINWANGKAIS